MQQATKVYFTIGNYIQHLVITWWKLISKVIYVYLYNCITLLCTWNIVSQLYLNKIYILKEKKKFFNVHEEFYSFSTNSLIRPTVLLKIQWKTTTFQARNAIKKSLHVESIILYVIFYTCLWYIKMIKVPCCIIIFLSFVWRFPCL